MTPRIVRVLGVKTPPNVPNLVGAAGEEVLLATRLKLLPTAVPEVEAERWSRPLRAT